MQTISKDSCDFAEIRSRGYLYVDKTAWFHRLATAEGEKMFGDGHRCYMQGDFT